MSGQAYRPYWGDDVNTDGAGRNSVQYPRMDPQLSTVLSSWSAAQRTVPLYALRAAQINPDVEWYSCPFLTRSAQLVLFAADVTNRSMVGAPPRSGIAVQV